MPDCRVRIEALQRADDFHINADKLYEEIAAMAGRLKQADVLLAGEAEGPRASLLTLMALVLKIGMDWV